MKRILGISLLLVIALVAFTPGAQAGFYLGASATQTSLKFEDAGESFNEDDTGWKAFAGWNIIKFFGLELDYFDMGSPSDSSGLSVDLQAASLSARGILPLGKRFELSAKVGYAAWDASPNVPDEDDSGSDVTYGVGAAFIIGSHFEIRAEYEIIDIGPDVGSADLDVISLGAAFRF